LTTEITVKNTPSDVLRAQFEAVNRKDAAAVKRTLSQRCLELYEQKAAEEKKPLEVILTRGNPWPKLPPNLSETINGDTAIVTFPYPKGYEWAGQLHFVREDGDWKFACDRTNAEIDRHMNPPAGTSTLVGGATPTATLLALCDAWNKGDFPAMKRNVSQDSLKLGKSFYGGDERGLDKDLLANWRNDWSHDWVPQVRNEKINGNRATLEVMNRENPEWSEIYFIKEAGLWKADFAEYFRRHPFKFKLF
jgi:hypothetical protein